VFAAEMDAVLRLSFQPGKAGILTDLPVAVAAEAVRIYSAKNPMPRSGRKYIIAGNAISTRASGV
jgi:hypothetical protein